MGGVTRRGKEAITEGLGTGTGINGLTGAEVGDVMEVCSGGEWVADKFSVFGMGIGRGLTARWRSMGFGGGADSTSGVVSSFPFTGTGGLGRGREGIAELGVKQGNVVYATSSIAVTGAGGKGGAGSLRTGRTGALCIDFERSYCPKLSPISSVKPRVGLAFASLAGESRTEAARAKSLGCGCLLGGVVVALRSLALLGVFGGGTDRLDMMKTKQRWI